MKRTSSIKRDPDKLRADFWALPSDDALVDRAMAGAVAHLGKKSMELLAMKGGGPPYSVNGKALYRKGDVLEWLRKRTHTIEVTAQRHQRPGKHLKAAASTSLPALQGA